MGTRSSSVNNMAAGWLVHVSKNVKRNLAVLVAAGAFVGITVYMLYRQKRKKQGGPPSANETQNDNQLLPEPVSDKKVLVMGLRGAGKTTLLLLFSHMGRVKVNQIKLPKPTEGFHVMCIANDTKPINVWEIGGSDAIREYWHCFIEETSLFVYVVNAADPDTMEESGQALVDLLRDERLKNTTAIVVFNKQDLEGALERTEILEKMGLNQDIIDEFSLEFLDTQVPIDGEMKGQEEFCARVLAVTD